MRKSCGRVSRFRWRGASLASDATGSIATLSGGGARSGSATGTKGSSTGTLRLRGDRDRGRPRVLLTYPRLLQVCARSRRRRGVVLAASGVGRSVRVAGSWAGRNGSGQQDTAARLLGLALMAPVGTYLDDRSFINVSYQKQLGIFSSCSDAAQGRVAYGLLGGEHRGDVRARDARFPRAVKCPSRPA